VVPSLAPYLRSGSIIGGPYDGQGRVPGYPGFPSGPHQPRQPAPTATPSPSASGWASADRLMLVPTAAN